MVRVISQETYDEVVKENIEEFLMTPEEAIEDAVKQFTAQGVDLSNVIKDLSLNDSADDIVSKIKKLSQCLKSEDYEQMPLALNALLIELEKDIARRVYAGKNGAYSVLMEVLTSCKDKPTLLQTALQTITQLMTGNPDLLDDDGVKLQKSLLESNHNEPYTTCLVLNWVLESSAKHEMNRQNIFNVGILDDLKLELTKKNPNITVIRKVCVVLRALTLDDDVRVEYGKAHEHATLMARQVLHTLTKLLLTYKMNEALVADIMLTLVSLIVRNEFCQDFEDAKGIQVILDIFTNFPDGEVVNWNALRLLKSLAGNDDVKAHIITSGIAPLIVYAISRFEFSEHVVAAGLACISALTLKSPSNAGVFYDCGAVRIIIDAIKAYLHCVNIIQQASWAIRNMSVRNRYESKEFISYGIEELFNDALKIHGSKLEDDIKAALRDLGLKVNLKERWTGKGHSLTHE